MDQPLVTVAVPIYNVEKYLDRCIGSLSEQTYRHLQILLVDDLSPDGCAAVCDRWAQKDPRITVIHKKVNEGQGRARNDALDRATGKYICFIDGDDHLEKNAIEALVTAAEKEEAEITVFGMKNVLPDGKEVSRFIPRTGERTYKGKEVLQQFLPDFIAPDPKGDGQAVFYCSSCVLMYRTGKLRELGWRYVSEREIISEDVYSLLNLFDGIASVTVVPEAFYCYCINPASFSRKYTPGRYEKIRHFYLETVKLCREKQYSEDIIHRVSGPYIAYTLATLKQETKAPVSCGQRWKTVCSIVRDEVLQQVLQQKKKDHENLQRKIVFFLMRHKLTALSMLLFTVKK